MNSNKIFVGNIQYQTTQEELQLLFSHLGECRFDLHHDKATGKPSGFGFCEFKDAATAAMAIEKFNGCELNGRALNVGYPTANASKQTAAGVSQSSSQSSAIKASTFAQSKAKDIQRQRTFYIYRMNCDYCTAPMKAAPGSVSQKVNSVMDSMSTAEIYDILMSIKEDPEQGKRHLQTNPSLAYALLQAQVILGFIPVDKANQYFVGYEASSSTMAVDSQLGAASSSTMQTAPVPAQRIAPTPATAKAGYAPMPSASSTIAPPSAPPSQPPGLAELVRMDPNVLPRLGLDQKTLKLVEVIQKVRAMPVREFELMTEKQKADLRQVFQVAGLPPPGQPQNTYQ